MGETQFYNFLQQGVAASWPPLRSLARTFPPDPFRRDFFQVRQLKGLTSTMQSS